VKLDRLDIACDKRHDNPLFQSPFGVEIDGHRYAVATTGSVLVAIKADFELTTLETGSVPLAISEWIQLLRANGKRINLASLREWAGTKVEPERCSTCGGTQKVKCSACNGRRWTDCECPHCGHLHDAECEECVDGTEPCPKCTYSENIPLKLGEIDGYPFNMELVLRALAIIESETALFWMQACEDHGVVYMGDENWLAAIMGIRLGSFSEETSVPTWSSTDAVIEVSA